MKSFFLLSMILVFFVCEYNALKISTFSKMLKKAVFPLIVSSQIMNIQIDPAFAKTTFPELGTRAPEFVLPSNTGKSISLADLKGKWTVLYFYPGDFTEYCTIEAQSFEKDIKKYQDLGVQIVGVSGDTEEMHLDFGKTYGLDFPLLSDQGSKVSKSFGSSRGGYSSRNTYLIDPEGNIRYIFTKVSSRIYEHSSDVLAKLNEFIKK